MSATADGHPANGHALVSPVDAPRHDATHGPEGIQSFVYEAVSSVTADACAAAAFGTGATPTLQAARSALRGRLFQRGARGKSVFFLSQDVERLCCGGDGGGDGGGGGGGGGCGALRAGAALVGDAATSKAPRLNVVHAGATVFKRRRARVVTLTGSSATGMVQHDWMLTDVGRSLIEKLVRVQGRHT